MKLLKKLCSLEGYVEEQYLHTRTVINIFRVAENPSQLTYTTIMNTLMMAETVKHNNCYCS